jgi:hypothetical protein
LGSRIGEDLALFKLDFKMAYDTIHLPGLFRILYAFGILDHFLRLVKMLFIGAEASVCINGGELDFFLVQRGIMQGYLLASYLFLVVEEALNIMARNSLKRIVLPEAVAEQVLIPYADEVDILIKCTERNRRHTLELLDAYGLATGLCINWPKSQIYWISFDPSPPWLARLPCPWIVERELAKLLGTPFGFNLHTQDIDNFFFGKIQKKLEY